jgi:hypothetical protein
MKVYGVSNYGFGPYDAVFSTRDAADEYVRRLNIINPDDTSDEEGNPWPMVLEPTVTESDVLDYAPLFTRQFIPGVYEITTRYVPVGTPLPEHYYDNIADAEVEYIRLRGQHEDAIAKRASGAIARDVARFDRAAQAGILKR